MRIGRINCRLFKDAVCNRLLSPEQKLPRFLVLHGNTTYEFQGNLTFKFVEDHLKNLDFIEIAKAERAAIDAEGIYFSMTDRFVMSEIKTRYPKDLGWRENLRIAVTSHYLTLKRGIILIMTTWGARRFLEED